MVLLSLFFSFSFSCASSRAPVMDWTRAVCPHTPRQTNTLLTQQLAFYLMTAAVSPSSFLFSSRHAMRWNKTSSLALSAPSALNGDLMIKYFSRNKVAKEKRRRPCHKMVIDYVRSADRESYWFSVIMDRRRNALPVFHDLKLNILLSAPPTQSLTTFRYMIIGDFKE